MFQKRYRYLKNKKSPENNVRRISRYTKKPEVSPKWKV